MSEAVTQLTESLLQQFKHETFVLLNTVDLEFGGLHLLRFLGFMPRMLRLFVLHWIIVRVS
ncbi:hypothetical protein AB9M62_47050 [Bacillales bacterium AN1005]